jgi:2-keto-4-pentenoate hydratase
MPGSKENPEPTGNNKETTSMELIDQLWQDINRGTLDGHYPELGVHEGQRLQLALCDRWAEQGEAVGGYKIGLTSGAARNSFGPGIRPFGYILKRRILTSGDSVRRSAIGKMGIENELVFRIGADTRTGEATPESARAIVDGVAPGFEINQIRLTTPASNGIRLAENLTQWGIVAGEFIHPDQDYESLSVSVAKDGETIETVSARDHIDDHFVSIARLINRLHQFGRGLTKGALVITGSYTRQAVREPGRWRGDFGALGSVELEVQ